MKKILLFIFFLTPNTIFADEIKQAITFYNQNNFNQAKEIIEKTSNKNKPQYWFYRGCIYHKFFKNEILSDDADFLFQETIKSYNEVCKFPNKRFCSYAKTNLNTLCKFLIERGNTYIKTGNYHDALTSFQRANKVDENNIYILKNIAIIYQKLGNNRKSLEIYKNQKFDNVLFSCNQAKFLLQERKYKQSLTIIKKLLAEHPYNVACIETFYLYFKRYRSKNTQEKLCNENLSKDQLINQYQKAVIAKLQNNFSKSYQIFSKIYKDKHDDRILIQLCDVGYIYAKQLILESNNDIEDEEKYNLAQDILDETIDFTEKLARKYKQNINVLEHLYRLYQQNNQEDKIAQVKSQLIQLGGDYILEV